MNMPSLSTLIVLDTLARTGSVRATASEVNLSQSAVSHKLRALENLLGFRIVEPKGRGITLTGEARRYVAAIRPGLASLREAHTDMDHAKGPLEIVVTSGFAATWLAPRLSDFLNRYPAISLKLRSATAGEVIEHFDIGIMYTDMPQPGSLPFFDVRFFPLCSPDFLHRLGMTTLDHITPDKLLHLNDQTDWKGWLGDQGVHITLDNQGILFTELLAMYAAAEAGLGLCLGDAVSAEGALRAGRLVRPFAYSIPAPASYWITPPPGGFTAPAAAFRDWIQTEVSSQVVPEETGIVQRKTP